MQNANLTFDIVFIYLATIQDACALGDMEAVEQIMGEVCESDPEALSQVRMHLAAAKVCKEEDGRESSRLYKEEEGKMEALALDSLLMLDSSRVLNPNKSSDGPSHVNDTAALTSGDGRKRDSAASLLQSPIAALDLDAASPSQTQLPQSQLQPPIRLKRPGGPGIELDLGSSNPGLVHSRQRLTETSEVGGQTAMTSRSLSTGGAESLQQKLAVEERGTLTANSQPSSQSKDLPVGWSMALDPSGKPYFWHQTTQKTVWERPTEDTPIK